MLSTRGMARNINLEIAKLQAAVWKTFTDEVQSWWPKDFYATDSPVVCRKRRRWKAGVNYLRLASRPGSSEGKSKVRIKKEQGKRRGDK